MSTKQISEVETITIEQLTLARAIEHAFERARTEAARRFGLDECCHSSVVKKWDRSSCSVVLELKSQRSVGGYHGWTYLFTFDAWCEKETDQ